jgi:hypothetical protein
VHRSEIPQFVQDVNIPGAEDLRTKLKQREAAILEALDDNEDLIVEYHSPAGAVIRIRAIAYYQDSDDALVLAGWDLHTGHECQIIAPPLTVHLVFRVIKIKEGEAAPERGPIGYIRGPEFGQS